MEIVEKSVKYAEYTIRRPNQRYADLSSDK